MLRNSRSLGRSVYLSSKKIRLLKVSSRTQKWELRQGWNIWHTWSIFRLGPRKCASEYQATPKKLKNATTTSVANMYEKVFPQRWAPSTSYQACLWEKSTFLENKKPWKERGTLCNQSFLMCHPYYSPQQFVWLHFKVKLFMCEKYRQWRPLGICRITDHNQSSN